MPPDANAGAGVHSTGSTSPTAQSSGSDADTPVAQSEQTSFNFRILLDQLKDGQVSLMEQPLLVPESAASLSSRPCKASDWVGSKRFLSEDKDRHFNQNELGILFESFYHNGSYPHKMTVSPDGEVEMSLPLAASIKLTYESTDSLYCYTHVVELKSPTSFSYGDSNFYQSKIYLIELRQTSSTYAYYFYPPSNSLKFEHSPLSLSEYERNTSFWDSVKNNHALLEFFDLWVREKSSVKDAGLFNLAWFMAMDPDLSPDEQHLDPQRGRLAINTVYTAPIYSRGLSEIFKLGDEWIGIEGRTRQLLRLDVTGDGGLQFFSLRNETRDLFLEPVHIMHQSDALTAVSTTNVLLDNELITTVHWLTWDQNAQDTVVIDESIEFISTQPRSGYQTGASSLFRAGKQTLTDNYLINAVTQQQDSKQLPQAQIFSPESGLSSWVLFEQRSDLEQRLASYVRSKNATTWMTFGSYLLWLSENVYGLADIESVLTQREDPERLSHQAVGYVLTDVKNEHGYSWVEFIQQDRNTVLMTPLVTAPSFIRMDLPPGWRGLKLVPSLTKDQDPCMAVQPDQSNQVSLACHGAGEDIQLIHFPFFTRSEYHYYRVQENCFLISTDSHGMLYCPQGVI